MDDQCEHVRPRCRDRKMGFPEAVDVAGWVSIAVRGQHGGDVVRRRRLFKLPVRRGREVGQPPGSACLNTNSLV